MCARREIDQDGQASVEWVGLVLLCSLLMLVLAAAAGVRLPGIALARAIASRLVCATGLPASECAATDPELVTAYGDDVAELVRSLAPTIAYEPGMRALPVDFRSCRQDACSIGAGVGEVRASAEGEPVTLFSRVIDCRAGQAGPRVDCSGDRAGRLFVQYWAYYPGSQSLRGVPTNPGFHEDDWESFQVSFGPDGEEVRASSHHGYEHEGGARNWLSDAGITHPQAWGPSQGRYYVSGGSHAGHAWEDAAGAPYRWSPGDAVRLIPIEQVARGPFGRTRFAITPPWRKLVYRDPLYAGTD